MIELRPYRPDDFDRVAGLFEAVDLAAYGFQDTTRAQLEQWFTPSRVDFARDTRLVFDDGRLAGYGDVDTEDGDTYEAAGMRIVRQLEIFEKELA